MTCLCCLRLKTCISKKLSVLMLPFCFTKQTKISKNVPDWKNENKKLSTCIYFFFFYRKKCLRIKTLFFLPCYLYMIDNIWKYMENSLTSLVEQKVSLCPDILWVQFFSQIPLQHQQIYFWKKKMFIC